MKIDYLEGFEEFVRKQQILASQKEYVLAKGKEVLLSVIEKHRETVE